jgi:glucokinase
MSPKARSRRSAISSSSVKKVLAYDLGGTKVAVGIIDSRGKVHEEIRVPVQIEQGKTALIEQLSDLGSQLVSKHRGVRFAGIASAGPLDPESGFLLDPTNFASGGEPWGKFPIVKLLSKKLRMPVRLENDAAAAVVAEHWVGSAKKYDNALILTLGTGLGTGMIVNGKLVRAGRNQHPEGGHIILNYNDQSAPCGCGNLGCAEAYLSGRSFARRARARFGNATLTAKDIADLARKRDPRAMAAFEEYAQVMAVALHNYAVIYAPEIAVFTGSFAESADLFLEPTRRHLEHLLARRRVGVDLLPKLAISSLENRAGLIGGAFVALQYFAKSKTR